MPITTHRTDGRDDNIDIVTLDEPGAGGAHHHYEIQVRQPATRGEDGEPRAEQPIVFPLAFQEGPVQEAGFNGLSNESLLAIVAHRLECFQAGQYATEENRKALAYVNAGLQWLHRRTRSRRERGVEGTSRR